MTRPTWNYRLVVYDACDEGIAALASVVGDLNAPMPCSCAWALAALSIPGLPTAPYVGWAIGRLVDPCDLGVVAGADMQGANLCDANLWSASLTGANLRGANLANACLDDANLAGSDLRGANLAGTDLTEAALTGARRDPSDPAIPGWVVVDGKLVWDFS